MEFSPLWISRKLSSQLEYLRFRPNGTINLCRFPPRKNFRFSERQPTGLGHKLIFILRKFPIINSKVSCSYSRFAPMECRSAPLNAGSFSVAGSRKIIFEWYKIGTFNLNFRHPPYEERTHSVQSIIGATDNLRDLYLFAFIE